MLAYSWSKNFVKELYRAYNFTFVNMYVERWYIIDVVYEISI